MSYRRRDAGGYAGWLRRELASRFPGDEVFRDVDSLRGGERWPERLDLTLARCAVILAVIGPDWLTAANEKGRRLDDPDDRVRLELEAGIRRGIPIVPALVGGAPMPKEHELPESLAPLHEWQAIRLSDENWEHDIERLVTDLRHAREAVPGELQLGAHFAGHVVEALIGRGGMGIVYRAHHVGLDRPDAIKVIAPALARDRGFRERFVRESHLAASLKHPNVISVYDAGEESGLLYLTMEFIDGRDLRTLLAHDGPLSPAYAAEILVPVADALQTAHEHGLIHRDVKPGNILIEEHAGKRRVYLGDYGLARQKSSATGLTSTGQWLGTADYVSPEQVMGEPVGPASDIYALGCVLFEMLSGRVPFPGRSETAKLVAHATKDPPLLTDLRPELPVAIAEVVRTAMARNPANRYLSATSMCTALESAISSSSKAEAALSEESRAAAKQAAEREQAEREQAERDTAEREQAEQDAAERVQAERDAQAAAKQAAEREQTARDAAERVQAERDAQAAAKQAAERERAEAERREQATPEPGRDTRRKLLVFAVAGAVVIAGIVAVAVGSGGGGASGGSSGNTSAGGGSSGTGSAGGGSSAGGSAGGGGGGRTISVGYHPDNLAVGQGGVWVGNFGDDTVSRIDPSTGKVIGNAIPVGSRPAAIGVGQGGVWVANVNDNTVSRIDATAGTVIGSPIGVGKHPYGIAVGQGSVWVANRGDNTVSRIDPSTGNVIGSPIRVGRYPDGVAVGQGSVWVANHDDNTVSRIDSSNGNLIGLIDVGHHPRAIAVGQGGVWVANYADNTVSQIDASTGNVIGSPISVGRGPHALAIGQGSVWVANVNDNTVSRIDAGSGEIIGSPIKVGKSPYAIGVGQGGVWVANYADNTVSRIQPN